MVTALNDSSRDHVLMMLAFAAWAPSVFAQSATPAKLSLNTGKEIYEAACIACHGPNGKGMPDTTVGFDKPKSFPDFTQCGQTTPELDVDWKATIRDGGHGRGFSPIMPSFADALTSEQIMALLAPALNESHHAALARHGSADVAWVVVLLSFASLGLGLLISTVVDSERQAVQLSMLVLLASVFFSGFVLPLDQFITPLRIAAYSLPVTHGIQLLQDLMLRGGTNQGWELLVLAGIGVALFLLTSLTVRRNLRSAT